MRSLLFIFLLALTGCIPHEHCPPMNDYQGITPFRQGQCVVYGGFIKCDRLGGYVEVCLLNQGTNTYIKLVAPVHPATSDGVFFCYLTPGTYTLVHYYATGFMKAAEYPIIKNLKLRDALEQTTSGTLKPYYIEKFTFTVEEGLNYAGTWNFSSGVPVFNNSKKEMDAGIIASRMYPYLDVSSARVALPQ